MAQFFLGNLKESANRTARRLIFAFLLFSLFCFSAGGGSAFGGLFSIPSAQAFEGPMQGPGQGTGAFGFTGGRFAVGTSTPLSDTRFVIIATSTEPGNYAMKVVYNKCDASQSTCPQSALPAVFSIRNDGSVVMGGGYFGTPSGGSSYYEPPNSTYERGLTVWGPTFINGPANAMSFLGGDIDPTLLTSGVFNTKGTNGPFAFRGSLGIATTTKDALPQPLSVYGGGYFSGNVGIGTVNPSSTLHVVGSIQQTSITSNFVYATTTGGFVGVSLGSNLVLSGGVLSSTGGSVTTSSAITANYIPYWTAATGSLNGTSTIYIKSDGKIGIGTSNPTSSLSVAGNIFATGSITGDSISGTFSGTVPAENVSPGVFATGNSSFQSSLGVGTSSATGLPSKLSVYGDEYVSGNLNLSATNDSATGVIKAGANRFLHGYSGSQAGTSVFLGTDAGNFTMSGYRNVGIGQEVLLPNTSGYLNTAVGYRALYSNNTGYGNSVIGDSALYNNTTGIMNSAVGYQILNGNTTSSYNAAVGGYALGGNANGGYGAAVGYNALVNSVGKGNSAIGYTAGKTSYGSYNSFLGYNAGRSVTDGTVNSSSSIIIGSKVGMPGDSVGRWLNIGNLLYGTGIYDASQGADTAVSATPVTDGKIGIGTYQPSSTLHVIGGGMFTGNVTTTNLTVSGISGSTQCLQVSSAGVVSGSGGTCGGSGSVSTSSPITANYIPYWTSVSGGLNGTSSVYASGASIGIGTTQPSSTLHVIGTITGTTLSGSFSGTVNASNVSAGTFASGNSNFQSSLGVGTSTATGLPANLSVFGTTQTTGTTTLAISGGNVGIGTAGPDYQLDIEASGLNTPVDLVRIFRSNASTNLTDSMFTLEHAGPGDPAMKFLLTGGEDWIMGIDNSDSDKFKIGQAANLGTLDRFTIDTTGNVGIGTTGPGSKLHVQGSTFPTILADRTSTGTNTVLSAMGVRHTTTGDMADGFGAGFTYQLQDSAGTANAVAAIFGVRDGADNTGGLDFRTYSAGTISPTAQMWLDSTGNVGIGTSSPGRQLQLSGTLTPRLSLLSTGSGVNNNANILFGDSASDSSGQLYYDHENDSFSIWTAGSRWVTVNNSGNVGIGTTQPSSTLHVVGSIQQTSVTSKLAYATSTGKIEGVAIGSGLSLSGGTLTAPGDGVGTGTVTTSSAITANYLPSWGNVSGGLTGTSPVYISGSNVGIGTTQPSSTLHVIGTITGTTLSGSFSGTVNASNVSAGTFASGNSNFQSSLGVGTSTATGLPANLSVFGTTQTTGTTTLAISGGNVGIGTTGPGQKLEVASGNLRLGSGSIMMGTTDTNGLSTNQIYWGTTLSTAGAVAIGLNGASGNGPTTGIFFPSRQSIAFSVDTSEKVRIDSTGNVGIGTTSPSQLLHLYKSGNATSRMLITQTGAGTSATAAVQLVGDDSNLFFGAADDAYTDITEYTGKSFIQGDGGAFALAAMDATAGELQIYTGGRAAGNRRVTIDINGNVGIGTTAPASKLNVAETSGSGVRGITMDQYSADDSGSRMFIRKSKNATAGSHTVVVNGTDIGGVLFQGSDGTTFRTAADILVEIDGSTISSSSMPGRLSFATTPSGSVVTVERLRIDSSGNVGIGTTQPSSTLHVIGTITGTTLSGSFSGTVNASNVSAGTFASGSSNFQSSLGVGTTTATGLPANLSVFGTTQTTGTTTLAISGGNVGIGTTGPVNKLDIEGGAVVGSSYSGTNTAPANGMLIEGNVTLGNSSHGVFTGGRLEVVGTQQDAIQTIAGFGARNSLNDRKTFMIRQITDDAGPRVILRTGDEGTVGSLNFATNGDTPSMTLVSPGKVGIGTTAPGAQLHVNQTSISGLGLRVDRNLTATSTDNAVVYLANINTGDDQAVVKIEQDGTGDALQILAQGDVPALYVKGTSGNVGIGTAGPRGQLGITSQVEGSLLTYPRTAAASQNIINGYYVNSTYTRYLDIAAVGDPDGTNGASVIRFLTNPITLNAAATEVMRIDGNGNVGIGTTQPSSTLHVIGTITGTTLSGSYSGTVNASNVSAGTFASGNSNFQSSLGVGTSTATGLPATLSVFGTTQTTGTTTLAISGGNVGIGTTGPGAKLHVSVDGTAISSNLLSSDDLIVSKNAAASGMTLIVASGADVAHRGVFKATRARGTVASPTAAASGDYVFSLLGSIYDGAVTRATAGVEMIVDGTVSSGVAPQRIGFFTGPTTTRLERLTIKNDGNVGIGTTQPSSTLHVVGTAQTNGQYFSTKYTATSALDWNNGNVQVHTLTVNTTFTFANGKAGARYLLILTQDATGSRTVTWPATVKWPSGAAPTLTTTGSKSDVITFVYDGTNYYGGFSLNY